MKKVLSFPYFKGFDFGTSFSQIELDFSRWRLSKFTLDMSPILSCFFNYVINFNNYFEFFVLFLHYICFLMMKYFDLVFSLDHCVNKVKLESKLSYRGFPRISLLFDSNRNYFAEWVNPLRSDQTTIGMVFINYGYIFFSHTLLILSSLFSFNLDNIILSWILFLF